MINNHKIRLALFFVLFLFTIILASLSLFSDTPDDYSERNSSVNDELFNPSLVGLNSLDKMCSYIDSIYMAKKLPAFDTAAYVRIASQVTKERFYFGLSSYTISENWIAYFASKFIWSHLSAIVNPNDILKHSIGLCSQQTIVFMEALNRRGINVRSVGLGEVKGPGHFICEVHYENSWRLHDVTKEPQWPKITNDHESLEYYLNNRDSLYKVYEYKMSRVEYNKLLMNVNYGESNKFPANKMLFFHKLTKAVTFILPILFFIMLFVEYRKYKSTL